MEGTKKAQIIEEEFKEGDQPSFSAGSPGEILKSQDDFFYKISQVADN